MENPLQFAEMSNEQRRIFVDVVQLHDAFLDAFRKNQSYRGGMHWKKAKGKQYLFRSLDRHGYGKSLGPRTIRTEAVYAEFHSNKKELKDKLLGLQARLKEQARFCKAARIARVPKLVTAVLRLLEQDKLLGRNLQVIGTNALFAYEAAAGVFFDSALISTRDMDVLWDVRSRLRFSTNVQGQEAAKGLMDILRKADRSFDLIGEKSFRAVNRSGYMVDLVKPESKSILIKGKRLMGDDGDLEAAEIRNLQRLIASPKFTHVVVGEDGFPATMVAPDPRAFALHKLWLSQQDDREPIKRKRDRAQALAIYRLVLHYFPNLKFEPVELRMFPRAIVTELKREIKESDLPLGYI